MVVGGSSRHGWCRGCAIHQTRQGHIQARRKAVYLRQLQTRFARRVIPDGQRICFRSDRNGEEHLWVSDAEGNNSVQITQSAVYPSVGHWSPDGRQLAVTLTRDGSSQLYTDFALHADGFSRMLVLTGESAPRGLVTPRRLGRLVQRLLEIETYRMAALLGLPVAREAAAVLGRAEQELAALADAIRSADRDMEPELLDRLTRLAGSVESHYAATHSRFSASRAYFALVSRRVDELAETRLEGMQTVKSFLDRRLAPAMSTCASADRRQQSLSQRISRISHLLRTRVEIEQQQVTQALLAAMNARQDLQLKLQSTVEGLSVAAITYYIVGLVSYLAKGAQAIGWPWSPETTAAFAIPVVVLTIWWLLRRLHRRVFKD